MVGLCRLAHRQGICLKRQAAGARTAAAVAAAAAQKSTHIALPAHTHTQRAMYKHFGFNGAGLGDGPDLIQTQLTR